MSTYSVLPAGLAELACLAAFIALWTKLVVGLPIRHGVEFPRFVAWFAPLMGAAALGAFIVLVVMLDIPIDRDDAAARKPIPPCTCSHVRPD